MYTNVPFGLGGWSSSDLFFFWILYKLHYYERSYSGDLYTLTELKGWVANVNTLWLLNNEVKTVKMIWKLYNIVDGSPSDFISK